MKVTAVEKPKWYQIRWQVSNIFFKIGTWIYPPNPEWYAHITQMMVDEMIWGKAISRIDPNEIYKPEGSNEKDS